MQQWSVRLKLLGRRNGDHAPGIGEVQLSGRFASRSAAEAAAEAWRRCPFFIWQADVVLLRPAAADAPLSARSAGWAWRGRFQ